MSASVHLGDIGLYVDMLGLFLGIIGFVLACWAAVAQSRKLELPRFRGQVSAWDSSGFGDSTGVVRGG